MGIRLCCISPILWPISVYAHPYITALVVHKHVGKNASLCFEVIWQSTTMKYQYFMMKFSSSLLEWIGTLKGRFSTGILLCTFCKRFITFFININVSRANNLFQPNKNQLSTFMSRWFPSCLFFCGYQALMLVDPQRELASHCLKLFWLSLKLRRDAFFLINTLKLFSGDGWYTGKYWPAGKSRDFRVFHIEVACFLSIFFVKFPLSNSF